MSFLNNAANQIWEEYGKPISDHLFLFPSRRSMLYFKQALTKAAGQNLWVPDCHTLERWILDQSGYLPVESITGTYELYQAARQVGFTEHSFEAFYPLAQIILSDFEEVDMALIPTSKFWAHTSEWVSMGDLDASAKVWNAMNDTPLKTQWLVNWKHLKNLYDLFTQNLENQQLSTKGRIYRETAGKMDQLAPLIYPRIHVIGFSSLSRAEAVVLEYFKSRYEVSFYWNDVPTLIRPGIDAGLNIHKWRSHFGQDLRSNPHKKPEIRLISANGMVSQIKMASQILHESSGAEDEMAVVLPHPSLIDLFLASFPDNKSRVNISMGYPLIYSPARSLIDWTLTLWEHMNENQGRIRNTDFSLLTSHPYIHSYFQDRNIQIPASSRLYYKADDSDIRKAETELLFAPISAPVDALSRLIDLIDDLISAQRELFHREILRYTRGRLVRLYDLLSPVEGISYVFLRRILTEMMQEASIPFRGEPLVGVQVLGVQEVQNLGFDTLIIPGMNEEILPSGKIRSMIPYSLRKLYRLPDQGDKHAVQSYYLWSSIIQAGTVWLIHGQGDDFLGSKGMNRYIFQIKYGSLDLPVTEAYMDLTLSGFEPGDKSILLNQKYADRLQQYLQEEGLSPTALLSYITCKFQFFLRYILRIREDDVATAGLDYRQMGTIIHEVMSELYNPWLNKKLNSEDFETIQNQIESVTRRAYEQLYPEDAAESLHQGIHWLEQQIIVKAVHRIISIDERKKEMSIRFLEADRHTQIDTARIKNVKLRGKIDRVDQIGNTLRIIDYKTGQSKMNNKSIAQLWEDNNPQHNWQLLFYAYLIRASIGTTEFEMGHYTLTDKKLFTQLKNGSRTLHTGADLEDFENVLGEIIDSMVDPDIPFSQTEDTNRCKYCAFKTFCERQGNG